MAVIYLCSISVYKFQEDGSDDSGVIQFRPTRTREAPDEKLDLSPRAKRAAAKR